MGRKKVMASRKVEGSKSKNTKPQQQVEKKKTAPAAGGVKKQRRWRPGTVALREIKRYQKSTELVIKRAPF